MSKARIGDDVPAEMTEGHEVETVFDAGVNTKASRDEPDGLENLRNAYQEFWSEIHPSSRASIPADPELENRVITIEPEVKQPTKSSGVHTHRRGQSRRAVSKVRRMTKKRARDSDRILRQRFGLPENFVPRIQRFGRSVLLDLNFYRLPNGQEFLPCLPTGPLGSRHLYALLTIEQFLQGSRGSVYVRNDGRIFDYSVVSAISLGDMFDTGYTIYDLERTGQYAPTPVASKQVARVVRRSPRKRAKKIRQKRYRRAAAAG